MTPVGGSSGGSLDAHASSKLFWSAGADDFLFSLGTELEPRKAALSYSESLPLARGPRNQTKREIGEESFSPRDPSNGRATFNRDGEASSAKVGIATLNSPAAAQTAPSALAGVVQHHLVYQ